MNIEISALKKGVSVVTGTPGRVHDHISQRHLITSHIRFLVLDEADRMLDMGFIDQVERIIRTLPKDRVTLLFSATIPDEVRSICRKYMKHPVTIELESDTKTVDTIEQVYYRVNHNEKNTQLNRLLLIEQPESCIIFCNTRRAVDRVQSFLYRKGYAVQALHGDIPQGKRLKTMQQFKRREFRLLVATDVAARGIHIDDLALVINYDVPLEKDSYIHRVGRTGRAGQKGRAITLVTGDDLMDLYEIEAHIGVLVEEQELPSEAVFNERRAQARNWIQVNSRKDIPSRAGHQTSSNRTRRKSSPTGPRQDPRKPKARHQASPDYKVPKEGGATHRGEQTKPVRTSAKSKALPSPAPDRAASKKSPTTSPPQNQKQAARVPFLLRVLQRITGK
jgi:ATP-dependent RNA helicase DeaD